MPFHRMSGSQLGNMTADQDLRQSQPGSSEGKVADGGTDLATVSSI